MQFYLNGYQPGDPDILAAAPGAEKRSSGLPETVDVLIVGSGPAGMLLAAQLSTFLGISTRLVERRPRPAAGRSGRRRRVPHGGDVRRFRPEREARPRILLGQ
jgi:NADPH-dependent 2,4-dienoyl-CoA reductase/sulfur reductase-like enzyme